MARETVKKYLGRGGPAGAERERATAERRAGGGIGTARSVVGAPRSWAASGRDDLEPHGERIRGCVQHEQLQLTRVQELLAPDGVRCSHLTLLRFVRRAGWSGRPRGTLRVAESQPGDVAEIGYDLTPLDDSK
jgi:hypothetical protein